MFAYANNDILHEKSCVFMKANSWGFQCLSNVRELTEYFLNGCYKHDINEENVLGMHGQLARAYADLMEQLWNGSNRSMAPRKLKVSF